MPGPFDILLTTIFVNNIVVAQFLGLCPFMGATGKFDAAVGMSIATTFVLTLTAAVSYLIEHYVLLPLGIGYLRIIVFIVIIASLVQFAEILIRGTQPLLFQVLGIFLPLITTNCAVLGVALLNADQSGSLAGAVMYGLGSALGFSLLLILFSAMREKLVRNDVPVPFQGTAINMITAGLLSLAFLGFAGLGS